MNNPSYHYEPLETSLAANTPAINDSRATARAGSQFWSTKWPLNKHQTALLMAGALILLGGGVTAAYTSRPADIGGIYTSKKPEKPAPKITTVPSNLSGLQVDPSVNQRPVTGVMIENSKEARPQSGLNQASIVFEAIAEGGVTRFMALYQDIDSDYIGPVRSLRPYYLQWCMGFDCAIAHVGGSPEALSNVREWGAKDLDQFSNSGAYTRISSRYAPHNVYTSTASLRSLESGKGFGAASYTGFARKTDAPSKAPNATSIQFNISSAAYNPQFSYDASNNRYGRNQAGAPHMVNDQAGNTTQITPKVIIAMILPYNLDSGGYYSRYNTVGSGQAFIFQDGSVTQATWTKPTTTAPLSFTDATGKAVPLNAGQTWITALANTSQAIYR